MPDFDEKIGERINARLNELNLKQADLCRQTGMSSNAISQYVTGKRVPDTFSLLKLSTALGVHMEWILTGNNPTIESKVSVNSKSTNLTCDGIPLSEDEVDLIAMYRLVDERDREDIFDYVALKYEKATGERASLYSTYTDTNKQQKSAPANGGKASGGNA